MMTEQTIINNWLDAFARDVDKAFLEAHVTSECNFLWHIFSYERVACLEEDEARVAFDRIEYEKAIRFEDGFGGRISGICETGKITAGSLDALAGWDVYIVEEDFTWTYVKTHENGWCGPYFCIRKPESERDGR